MLHAPPPELSVDDLKCGGNPLVPNSYQAEEFGKFVEKFCKIFAVSSLRSDSEKLWVGIQANINSPLRNSRISSAKPEHVPRIRRDDFEASHLKPGAYSMEDILAAIIGYFGQDKLTLQQLKAGLQCKQPLDMNAAPLRFTRS